MQMERLILLLLLFSCGKGNIDANDLCRPQSVRIAECITEEFEKIPNRLMIEIQRKNCEQRFPFNICYYR